MYHPATKHTLDIFKRIYDNLPPLVPETVRREMKQKFEEAMEDGKLDVKELEDIMIVYGKRVWPYIQAFEKIYEVYKHELAERLFNQRASPVLRDKYTFFKETGGNFADLYSGTIGDFFGYDENVELGALLVDLEKDLRRHTYQAVLSHDREIYEEKIDEYGELLAEVEEHFQALKELANRIEHKNIEEDIRSKLRAFEYSVSFLGPRVSFDEIRGAYEYFLGRIDEIKYRV